MDMLVVLVGTSRVVINPAHGLETEHKMNMKSRRTCHCIHACMHAFMHDSSCIIGAGKYHFTLVSLFFPFFEPTFCPVPAFARPCVSVQYSCTPRSARNLLSKGKSTERSWLNKVFLLGCVVPVMVVGTPTVAVFCGHLILFLLSTLTIRLQAPASRAFWSKVKKR